jgi:hypothetical protein
MAVTGAAGPVLLGMSLPRMTAAFILYDWNVAVRRNRSR